MIKNILKRMMALSLAGCLVLTGCNKQQTEKTDTAEHTQEWKTAETTTVWKVPGGGHIYARENDRNEQFQFAEGGYLRG